MEAPATLESCGIYMFPICLARRDFCFLLLTVASSVYREILLKTWKSCWFPPPLFVQLCLMYREVTYSVIVLHAILYNVLL